HIFFDRLLNNVVSNPYKTLRKDPVKDGKISGKRWKDPVKDGESAAKIPKPRDTKNNIRR
ncbi:MAG TPA: hypothetical protein VLL74_04505, partial [Methanoregula sp.]|nr:hypothetical protein [Methanoregula sp.]